MSILTRDGGVLVNSFTPKNAQEQLAFKALGEQQAIPLTQNEFVECFTKAAHDCGLRTKEDVIGLKAGYLTQNIREGLNRSLGATFDGQNVIKFDRAAFGETVKFGESGTGIAVGNFSTFWQMLIRKVGSTESPTWALTPYFPDAVYTSNSIVVEVSDAMAGTLQQRAVQTQLPQTQRLGYTDFQYAPAAWGSEKIYTEAEIWSRKLGDSNVSVNGMLQRMGWDMYDLRVKGYVTRKYLMSQMVFTGQYSYAGNTISAGIPSQNTLTPPSGNAWATSATPDSNGYFQINPAATPLLDMQTLLNQNEQLRKYGSLPIKMFMNGQTHQLFYSNPNNQNTVQFAFGNSDFVNNSEPYSMARALKYFLSSNINIEIEIVNDQYIPQADDPFGNASRAGKSTFIIPTGYILFAIDVDVYGGPLGEFAFTLAAQNGGLFNPQPGPWSVIEDCSMPGTVGGISNPFVRLAEGFNGAPKINRPFDIFVLNVLPSS